MAQRNWEKIMQLLSKCRTLQDFADHSLELVGNPIIIFNSNLVVAACTNVDVADENYQHLRQYGMPPEEMTSNAKWRNHIREIIRNDALTFQDMPNLNGVGHMSRTLRINGTMVGQLECASHLRSFEPEDSVILDLIGNYCAAILLNQMSLQNRGASEADYFFEYLLDGHQLTETAAQLRVDALNIPLGRYHYIMTTNADDVGTELQAENVHGLLGFRDRVLRYKGNLVLLLTRDYPMDQEEMKQLRKRTENTSYAFGFSLVFTEISRISQAFQQSRDVLEAGKAVNPELCLYRCEDYLEYLMLLPCCRSEHPLQFVLPGLVAYASDPRIKRLQVLETLKLYFRSGKSVNQVAETLHMHRNTVNYRISSAFEDLHIDSRDGSQVLKLENSLLILELLDRAYYF